MEVKAWTYRKGWKAPQCAGVIHTDFEKGFIRAEVIKYEDYIKYGSEAAVREAGKLGVEAQGIRSAGRRHHALPLQRIKTSIVSCPEIPGSSFFIITSICYK